MPLNKVPRSGLHRNTVGATASNQAALHNADALHRAGRFAEAERLYSEILSRQPDCTEALHRLAGVALQTGRPELGAQLIAKAIALEPDVAAAHANLGYALNLLGRFEDALAAYDRAIALEPDYAEAHFSRGVTLDTLERSHEALSSFDRAIALKPDHFRAHRSRGTVLFDLGRLEEAAASLETAIELNSADAAAYFNLGNVCKAIGCHEDALANYTKAAAVDPALATAHNNRGIVLTELRRFEEAIDSFDKAVALKPDYPGAFGNRAIAWNELKHHDKALSDYDRAIVLDPQFAAAHYGRAIVLDEMKRPAEALAGYKAAFALAPRSPFLLGKLVHMKMAICEWDGLQPLADELLDGVTHGERLSPPFQVLPVSDSPEIGRKAAEIYARDLPALPDALPEIGKHAGGGKIRLGYFSADFHDHATAVLTAGLFEHHDRARFELFAFSFGPSTDDAMRERLIGAFDRFLDVRGRSEREIALLARELGIDIAVDLKGYTGDGRHKIFAYRAAPIQVNYLGYPGTMGAGHFDYLIADRTLIPETDRRHYSERIVYLPRSYQPNDKSRVVSPKAVSRSDAGLPEKAFVYCCFNNSYKITPDRFDIWMRILDRIPDSVLWLLDDNREAVTNLRKEAALRNIDADRLVFAPRLPLPEHLARHELANLFLDTLPYNAHTTASDALWMALPVLTEKGHTFAGRVAASLLNAVDLAELVASTPQEYETLAVELAARPEKLAAIRQMLASRRQTASLFDIVVYTKSIEAAYIAMHERQLSGAPPDHTG